LNSGKPLGTSCCEWLWSIATWANKTLSFDFIGRDQPLTTLEQWKAPRHRLLWVACGQLQRGQTGHSRFYYALIV